MTRLIPSLSLTPFLRRDVVIQRLIPGSPETSMVGRLIGWEEVIPGDGLTTSTALALEGHNTPIHIAWKALRHGEEWSIEIVERERLTIDLLTGRQGEAYVPPLAERSARIVETLAQTAADLDAVDVPEGPQEGQEKSSTEDVVVETLQRATAALEAIHAKAVHAARPITDSDLAALLTLQGVVAPGTPVFVCPICEDPWETEQDCAHALMVKKWKRDDALLDAARALLNHLPASLLAHDGISEASLVGKRGTEALRWKIPAGVLGALARATHDA